MIKTDGSSSSEMSIEMQREKNSNQTQIDGLITKNNVFNENQKTKTPQIDAICYCIWKFNEERSTEAIILDYMFAFAHFRPFRVLITSDQFEMILPIFRSDALNSYMRTAHHTMESTKQPIWTEHSMWIICGSQRKKKQSKRKTITRWT